MNRREFLKAAGLGAAALIVPGCTRPRRAEKSCAVKAVHSKPNILWIIAEDMSPNWSCYGGGIQTPNIDLLADTGVLFRNAFVTGPVCSPSRSAMITGMYQTTIGAHHHRSSYPGSEIRLPKQVKLLPEYFKEHGYYTVNGGPKTTVYSTDPKDKDKKLGKTDYNFVWQADVYDGNDWNARAPGQPFFAQIQLQGGKYRAAKVANPVDPASVKLPPYYPDHPVIREDWAQYLNSILYLDSEVGKILKRLEDEGIADNTIVILWTDHGISHARGKQFVYDEGMRIPLIIRWPGAIEHPAVCDDLVSHIDIAATSLYMAGIPIPDCMQGRPLFGPGYKPREYVFAARDRCDETLDCIRAVRTKRYKYIRNFYPDRAHLQPNRYKDGKLIIKTMRRLFAEGRLNSVQAGLFAAGRPAEELYDLQNDPYEIHNLADSPKHQRILRRLRVVQAQWMRKTGDLGLIPEPVLEELAGKDKGRDAILRQKENLDLIDEVLRVTDPATVGRSRLDLLIKATSDRRAAVRWWAAMRLGSLGTEAKEAQAVLERGLADICAGVRVACARALCKMGAEERGLPVLLDELKSSDQVVRHYAALAMEDAGEKARPALEALQTARADRYEYVRRVAERFVTVLTGTKSDV